jgi:hypothetical protein
VLLKYKNESEKQVMFSLCGKRMPGINAAKLRRVT